MGGMAEVDRLILGGIENLGKDDPPDDGGDEKTEEKEEKNDATGGFVGGFVGGGAGFRSGWSWTVWGFGLLVYGTHGHSIILGLGNLHHIGLK
jgi:hypothetical protein